MLNQVLATLLPLLIWGALTGIINLAFGYKSQIEAWAESRPRVAALLKFSRAVGLDPWNILSAVKLFASEKLPDAQKADSPIAKSEQRKADKKARDAAVDDRVHFGPLLVLLFVGAALAQQGCASWKTAARTAFTATELACAEFFGEKQKLSIEDAARQFCATRKALEPWEEAILAAKREAGPIAAARHP